MGSTPTPFLPLVAPYRPRRVRDEWELHAAPLRARRLRVQRQLHDEVDLSGSGKLRERAAAVQLRDRPHQVQAEAHAAVAARVGAVALHEAREDALEVRGGQLVARVA